MELKEIQIDKITTNPLQPRQIFDKEKIEELANSIKEAGLLQPIVLRKMNGTYQIIAGERRWRALSKIGKKTIPSIIWDAKSDIDALEKSAIENLQREDLTSVERENVINELWKSGQYKNHRDLATKLGYQESNIGTLIAAKIDREKFRAAPEVSSRVIDDTRGLEPEERKQIIRKVERGDIGASKVREEVKLIKAVKEIKEKYKVEIPQWMKKAEFTLDFVKECSKPANYFEYCMKAPKEAWEKTFTESQLKNMKNNAIFLFNKLNAFLEFMGWE
jgi:ParB family chromosome partitioning protein